MASTRVTDGAAPAFAVKITLLLTMALPMMAFAPLSPALPAIAAHFSDVPNVEYLSRFVLTLPAIFIAILSPVAGFLVDRFGRKRLLLGSIALYGVVGVSGAAFDSLPALLASRGVMGIAMAGILTATTTLVGDYYSGKDRQRFLGLRGAFVNYAAVLINVLGGLIAVVNWRASFAIFIVAFALLPLVSRFLYEPSRQSRTLPAGSQPAEAGNGGGSIADAEPVPGLFLAFAYALTIAWSIAFFMVPVQLPFYLRVLGAESPAIAGLAIATSGFSVATMSLFYARIRSRLSAEAMMAIGFGLVGVAFFFVADAEAVSQVFASVALAGIGFGFLMANVVVWILDKTPERVRGRVAGGIATATFVGQFCSPLVSQPIANAFGLAAAYATIAAGMAVISGGFVLFLLLRRGGAGRAVR